MADIELVVKLPEEIYNRFGHEYSEENLISKYTNDVILEAFCNGTPLPKGHGDLVDVNEVEEYLNDIQFELDGWGETDGALEIAKARMGLDSVPAIIESDKESEE